MRVADIMTSTVATVRPETSLKEAARELLDRRISGMPVVDAAGRVVGVVSETDVLIKERGETAEERNLLDRLRDRGRADERQKVQARTAGDAMTIPAVTISSSWSIPRAAGEMLEHGVNRLPVVNHGRLVGIITRADLVRAFTRSDAELERELREQVRGQQALVEDTSPVAVEVADGEVTVTGRLKRRTTADALSYLLGRTPGVVGVESKLTWATDDR